MGDFAVRQAAKVLGKGSDAVDLYSNRSMGFALVWDPTVTSDGFSGFAQRRFPVSSSFWERSYIYAYLHNDLQNGSFAFSPPDACSPVDPTPHSCVRGTDNNVGFYECTYQPVLPSSYADLFV